MPPLRFYIMEITSKEKNTYRSTHSSQRVQERVVNHLFPDSFNKVKFQFYRKITILLSMGAMCGFPGRTYRRCSTVKKTKTKKQNKNQTTTTKNT